MTTDRAGDGVRVKIKRSGETGTALYGPYRKYDRDWPGFSRAGHGWVVPVRFDREGWRGVGLYSPSELEPGPEPSRSTSTHGSRRVRHRERQETGTLLESLVLGGITWPALDRGGNLVVPVVMDDGTTRTWRASFIEPAMEREPEPSPAWVPKEPPYGPRVMVRNDGWPASRLGRVLYRAIAGGSGRVWPDFDGGEWRVPVRMEATGAILFIPATDLRPFTEPERGPVARALFDQAERAESDESAILAEADRVANAIQAKSLRDVTDAAAEALELFASRLRAMARKGDGA